MSLCRTVIDKPPSLPFAPSLLIQYDRKLMVRQVDFWKCALPFRLVLHSDAGFAQMCLESVKSYGLETGQGLAAIVIHNHSIRAETNINVESHLLDWALAINGSSYIARCEVYIIIPVSCATSP